MLAAPFKVLETQAHLGGKRPTRGLISLTRDTEDGVPPWIQRKPWALLGLLDGQRAKNAQQGPRLTLSCVLCWDSGLFQWEPLHESLRSLWLENVS